MARLLDEEGFAAEPHGSEIHMRRCPFHDLAETNPEIVCGVHRGLMAGALEELGSDLEVEGLDVFVRPDLCVARTARRQSTVDSRRSADGRDRQPRRDGQRRRRLAAPRRRAGGGDGRRAKRADGAAGPARPGSSCCRRSTMSSRRPTSCSRSSRPTRRRRSRGRARRRAPARRPERRLARDRPADLDGGGRLDLGPAAGRGGDDARSTCPARARRRWRRCRSTASTSSSSATRSGSASAVKMSTASVYKGSVALLTQALRAADHYGVLEHVLDDLGERADGAAGGSRGRRRRRTATSARCARSAPRRPRPGSTRRCSRRWRGCTRRSRRRRSAQAAPRGRCRSELDEALAQLR